jgi:uncharacterized HAD superfamily protein
MSSTSRKTIAIDIDEVLGAFLDSLCLHINTLGFESKATISSETIDSISSVSTTSLVSITKIWKPEDFTSYHFNDAWNIDETIAHATMARFFTSLHFEDIKPLKDAKEILLKHSNQFRFIVVTSRNSNLSEQTNAWLNKHFEGCFDNVMFGSAYGPGVKRTKSEMCREINAIMLVDDNPFYAVEAAPVLKTSILFGNYAWNRTTSPEINFPSNIMRVSSWSELDLLFTNMTSSFDLLDKLDTIQLETMKKLDDTSLEKAKRENLKDVEKEISELRRAILLDSDNASSKVEEFLSLFSS